MNPRKTLRDVKNAAACGMNFNLNISNWLQFDLTSRYSNFSSPDRPCRNCTLSFPSSSFSSLLLRSILHWSPSPLCNHRKKKPPPHPCSLLSLSMLHTFNDLHIYTLFFSPFNSLSDFYVAHFACVPLSQLCLLLHFDHFFHNPLTCAPSCLLSFRLVDFFCFLFVHFSQCLPY